MKVKAISGRNHSGKHFPIPIAVLIATIGISIFAATTYIFIPKQPQFKPLEKQDQSIQNEAVRLFKEGIKTKNPFDQYSSKIEFFLLKSGGVNFRVFSFPLKETCGKLGCLYVAVNGDTQERIPLQLKPLLANQLLFLSSEKQGCFSVKQATNGALKDYEICGK